MTTNSELVSIVIPVYRVEDFLPECLDSVLAQSYPQLEIILVDDGSPDRCPEICNRYAKQDQRIKVIHQQNAGLSGARNAGIAQAKGKYLAFVDSDDTVAPDFIAKLLQSIQEHHADIAVSAFENQKLGPACLDGFDALKRLLLQQENLDIVAWNKLYRRELFTKYQIEYPLGQNNEDTLTTYKLYAHAERVCYLPDQLYNYRHREGSIMQSTAKLQQLTKREQAAQEACTYLKGKQRKLADISLLLAHFAYIDHALAGRIPKEYYQTSRAWILAHKQKLQQNPYLSKKLAVYFVLIAYLGGYPYQLFRKIRHE